MKKGKREAVALTFVEWRIDTYLRELISIWIDIDRYCTALLMAKTTKRRKVQAKKRKEKHEKKGLRSLVKWQKLCSVSETKMRKNIFFRKKEKKGNRTFFYCYYYYYSVILPQGSKSERRERERKGGKKENKKECKM